VARRTGNEAVYAVADRWREACLVADGSLGLGAAWEPDQVRRLLEVVTAVGDRRGFLDELIERLADEPALARLAAEAAVVYYLFVWEGAVGPRGKRRAVGALLALAGEQVPEDGDVAAVLDGQGVGHPGQYFVAHLQPQLALVLQLAQRVKDRDDRAAVVEDPWTVRDLVDELAESGAASMRHVVLHLLHPDAFERISSGDHKQQILDTYGGLLDDEALGEDDDDAADVDQRLLRLRGRLAGLLGGDSEAVDYYDPPLKGTWGGTSDASGDLVTALDLKRQVVLYGPPGTGKTHEAKLLAERIVRRAAMRRFGPAAYLQREEEVAAAVARQVRRLQLHPAYSYEEFVRGQRLAEGGGVRYEDGYLLRLVEEMEADGPDGLPWVLVLDELNRADLSRVLGEAFSVLEDRDSEVELPGVEPGAPPRRLRLPGRLYVIGTMNLIDQSLEQVDFALRRRFLWHRSGYDPLRLRGVLQERWQGTPDVQKRYRWEQTERLQDDVALFVDRCTVLNAAVAASPLLGEDYEVGHTYFFDVVGLLARAEHLHRKQRARHFLFRDGKALPPVDGLWAMSLRPLLEQYLQGIDAAARRSELDRLAGVFLAGAAG